MKWPARIIGIILIVSSVFAMQYWSMKGRGELEGKLDKVQLLWEEIHE